MSFGGGKITVNIKGLNLTRLINNITQKFGAAENIEYLSRSELNLTLKKNISEKVIAYLKDLCYNIEVINETGFKRLLKISLSRIGLLAGFAACLVLIALYNSILWRVDITCSDVEVLKQAEQLIDTAKVRQGVWISGIDTKTLAQELETKLDKVAAAIIKVDGVVLSVDIKIAAVSLPAISEGDGFDIIALYDCRIDEISVLTGTAVVKPGDIVKAGTVLVAGYKIDETGEKPINVPQKAHATVYGTVWFTSQKVYNPVIIEEVRTGKSTTNTEIRFLYFSRRTNKKIPYTKFQTETTEYNAGRRGLIPIYVKKTVTYEIEVFERTVSFEDVREDIEKQLIDAANLKVPKNCKQYNTYTKISNLENLTVIDAVVETRALVSIRGA